MALAEGVQQFSRGCNGTEGVVADPEYGTLVEYSDYIL